MCMCMCVESSLILVQWSPEQYFFSAYEHLTVFKIHVCELPLYFGLVLPFTWFQWYALLSVSILCVCYFVSLPYVVVLLDFKKTVHSLKSMMFVCFSFFHPNTNTE